MARDPQHEQTQFGGQSGVIVVGLAIVGFVGFMALAMVTRAIGPAAIAIWAITGASAVAVLRGPVGQAIGRSLGGHAQQEAADLPMEVYAELDELRARVGELEERVDFSERLLTKAREEGAEA